jgi:speckle-type POZ protein
VLAARSPVFAAELFGDMRESTTKTRVMVDDMSALTFRAMLRFIYTAKLPIKAKKNDATSRACKEKSEARRRVAMACDLLVAADRYDLEKLRFMCQEILSESMHGCCFCHADFVGGAWPIQLSSTRGLLY